MGGARMTMLCQLCGLPHSGPCTAGYAEMKQAQRRREKIADMRARLNRAKRFNSVDELMVVMGDLIDMIEREL